MDTDAQRPRGQDTTYSSLNVTIEALNLAKDLSGIVPAKVVFGSVSSLLTMIRVCFLPLSDDRALVSHVSRTPLLTNKTTSSWGWAVLMFARPLTGE